MSSAAKLCMPLRQVAAWTGRCPYSAVDKAVMLCADWARYSFSDSPSKKWTVPQLEADSDKPPEVCPAWSESGNQSPGYGDVIAYPASHLQAKCHEATTQQQDNAYTCVEDAVTGMPVITNFWSTGAVDTKTSKPLARVLIDVRVLDVMNQTVAIGEA